MKVRPTLLKSLTLLAAFAACPGVHLYASPTKPKVALVMKSLANEFFLTMEEGAKQHQAQHPNDFTLIANGIKDETDTAAQIKIVQQMIAEKVDAIVLAPADSKALVPVVKQAVDAGVLVVNIDNKLDAAALKEKGLSVPFVGPDNRKGAKLVGAYLAKSLKAGDKVGILEGVSTTFNAQQRTAGFKDAMQAVNANVVSVQSGQWEMEQANTVASAMLREHPDLKALLCGNDNMALGAVAAVKTSGLTGKVAVVGYDNIDAVHPLMAEGRMLATADQYGSKQAVFGIQIAVKAVKAGTKQNAMPGEFQTQVDLVTK